MVNRAALIVRYKEPFVKWINESDPYNEDMDYSIDDANEDNTVYLIDHAEAENLEEWIGLNFAVLFENELVSWYTDEALWPENRDLKLFKKWCAVECHTVLIDAGTDPVVDEEI